MQDWHDDDGILSDTLRVGGTTRASSTDMAADQALPAVHREAEPWYRGRLAAVGAMLLVSLLIGLWSWHAGSERRELLQMPAEERAELYRETRRHAEEVCQQSAAQPWLLDRCRRATEFLLLFPECDAECAAFARRYTSQPAR